ncbi:MAG: ribonuclease H-like domain-containing protein [Pyrinomonadaceae bacterium]
MLKSEIHEPTLFFDLEWVPDAEGAIKLFDLPEDTPELEAMGHLWRATPAYDAENNPRPFVKYLFSRVVSIAFLSRRGVFRDGERRIEFGLHSLPKLPVEDDRSNEAEIIERFLYMIGERDPQLVGFNSMESDLQVLIQRGLVNEVRAEKFSARPAKPWEGRDYFDKYSEAHLDITKILSPGAMKPTLNGLARLCGFPGKLDVDGRQVVDLWLDGKLTEIVEYNQIDTLNTYLVWLRIANFTGKLSEEEYASEFDDFVEFLNTEASKPEGANVAKFLEHWGV